MARIDGRAADQLRPVEIIPNINQFAEGSCLIRCGSTHVLCCASVEEGAPRHVPEGKGWVTAEYSMLPRANRERSRRDIAKLKLSPRSAEIQRLIGRALRACVDMKKLGERTITIDCDVLQGGRRHPHRLRHRRVCGVESGPAQAGDGRCPARDAADQLCGGGVRRYRGGRASVGSVLRGGLLGPGGSQLRHDRRGELVELQGTGEGRPFTIVEQRALVELCAKGIRELQNIQRQVLGG